MKISGRLEPYFNMSLHKYCRMVVYLFITTVISLTLYSIISEWKRSQSRNEYQSLSKSDKSLIPSFKTNTRPLETTSEIQQQRKKQLERVCNVSQYNDFGTPSFSSLGPVDFHALYYDDENKIVYCEVPKVACSNWKRVLLMMSGKMKAKSLLDIPVNQVHSNLSKSYLKRMSELNTSEIFKRLDPQAGYFKFVFVRKTFERLLSAYRNKFLAPYSHYFHKRFGRYIVRHIRTNNSSKESLERGHDVTFAEFIRFITNKEEIKFGKRMNAHWRPISELCLPCVVDYDFVGKYEHMDDGEVDFVLDRLNVRHLSFPPGYHSGPNRTAAMLKEHYGALPFEDIKKLKLIYRNDFEMFYPSGSTDVLLFDSRSVPPS